MRIRSSVLALFGYGNELLETANTKRDFVHVRVKDRCGGGAKLDAELKTSGQATAHSV